MKIRHYNGYNFDSPEQMLYDSRPLTAREFNRERIMATKTTDTPLLEVSKSAPDFSLPDQLGKTHRLRDYRGNWVVLYFSPKDDTSGCTKQACQFQGKLQQFKNPSAVILGVSPDPPESHLKFADKYNLTFTLLADEQKTICTKYGVWQRKSMYGRSYMGVVRTTYLINPAGKIVHRWEKVKVPKHDAEVMKKIAALS